jgi:hypothetical protein
MIGDHAVAGLLLAFCLDAGQLLRCGDQRLERVGIIIVVHALHDGGDALQPHAGVDRRLGQVGTSVAIILPLELHEHEVPDFDEAVAILVRADPGGPPGICSPWS